MGIPIDQKLILTIKEACEYTSIGDTTMRKLLSQPQCPFLILNGNRKLIKRKQLERWIESQEYL